MKWLLILRAVLDLIAKLPLNAPNEAEIEEHVRATVQTEPVVQALDEAGVHVNNSVWERAIPHIVALIQLFLELRSGGNPGIVGTEDAGTSDLQRQQPGEPDVAGQGNETLPPLTGATARGETTPQNRPR